jgi:hypothetical protein
MVFEPDVEEDEDTSSPSRNIKPWDPKRIRITTKSYTLREINTQIGEQELDLAPEFQRSFIWSSRQQVRLIESILLGIPLPAFYFNLDAQGGTQVIDGVQRLTTVHRFMRDRLTLNPDYLEYLRAYAEHKFSDFDAATRRRFWSTQIVAHVIEPQTPDEVKYDIFNRVNTGGSPLKPQEIRHCMSKSPSREFLRQLVTLPSFDEATEFAFWNSTHDVRNDRRMTDREMALRFCAFKTVSVEEYSKATSLDSFLLDFTRRIDKEENINLARLRRSFDRAMTNCAEILGEAAFRRWPPESEKRGPINRAVFESHSLALADYRLSELTPHKNRIRGAFRRLFEDPEYEEAVRSATGDPRRLERRIDMPRQKVEQILR